MWCFVSGFFWRSYARENSFPCGSRRLWTTLNSIARLSSRHKSRGAKLLNVGETVVLLDGPYGGTSASKPDLTVGSLKLGITRAGAAVGLRSDNLAPNALERRFHEVQVHDPTSGTLTW